MRFASLLDCQHFSHVGFEIDAEQRQSQRGSGAGEWDVK